MKENKQYTKEEIEKMGLCGQMKFKKPELLKDFTKEELTEILDKLCNSKPQKDRMADNPRIPDIKHYEWEEDGQQFSSWRIDTGSMVLHTGDRGKAEFDRIFKEEMEKLIKNAGQRD